MITGAQIRMARAALRLSPEELAHRCGLAYATIWRAESTDEFPAMIVKNLMKIRHELEKAGVIFFDGEVEGLKGTGAGVRLRK